MCYLYFLFYLYIIISYLKEDKIPYISTLIKAKIKTNCIYILYFIYSNKKSIILVQMPSGIFNDVQYCIP